MQILDEKIPLMCFNVKNHFYTASKKHDLFIILLIQNKNILRLWDREYIYDLLLDGLVLRVVET